MSKYIIRDDISHKLIHLIKNGDRLDAQQIFYDIFNEKKLQGGTGYIMGHKKFNYRCVCFTEAPISNIGYLLANNPESITYEPYGIMVSKKWLFKNGGRPVIYQKKEEFELLHDEHKYRHVTYDLDKDIDYSWQREWRIKTDELLLDLKETTFILPNRDCIETVLSDHLGQYDMSLSEFTAYHFIALEDLGVCFENTIS